MDVPVDDRHPLGAFRLRVPRRDRHVVEQTETHRPVGQGMVPRRTDERKTAPLRRLDRGSRGEERGLVARRRGDRVRVEHGRLREHANPLHVVRRVTALEVGLRRSLARPPVQALEQHLEAPRRIRVLPGRMQPGHVRMA